MSKIDAIDCQILELLQLNGRITVKELSEKLGLSPTPIFERTKKLEKAGIIDHYAAVINGDKLGKKLYAFAHISLKDHSKELVDIFTSQITKLPQVMECHYTTGDTDFILKILLDDMEMYRDFVLTKLFEMKNIGKIETYLSLSVLKKSNFIPIS
ncbi:MAG: Lrp/AsnC family transcriptional regulator [Bacteroidetes bacterium]|nr:MAG: Lrp/AsnC family transcriptional regulator [Bacteroidota bacterium]MBL1145692.1 Lrp/AsnC family transcriptional regulator [Bacteroidota bacterium]MCB0370572.1 Lrp/AsnC family transcriptional regulator [Bdellovibrionales bacterium]NOG58486.1 Lrp/AsnC family transcriptional regulator [Bacteroidota bacterium]